MELIPDGTEVFVHIVIDRIADDWSPDALEARKNNVYGKVIGHHETHGICYDVRHRDGTIGYYEPHELITRPPDGLGDVEISDQAQKAFDNSGYQWQEFWPRHTKALTEGKSCLSVITLPNGINLFVGTNREHTLTTVCTEDEFTVTGDHYSKHPDAEFAGIQSYRFDNLYIFRKKDVDELGGATMLGQQMVAVFSTLEKAKAGAQMLGFSPDDFDLMSSINPDETIKDLLNAGLTLAIDPGYDDEGKPIWGEIRKMGE